jgi:hypothetical protein
VKIQLSPDWNEFLSLLISKRVRFLLVGGHAVAAHGEPRLTEDLDVFVDPAQANAGRLREALLAFGFGASVPSARELRDVAMLQALSSASSNRPRKPPRRRAGKARS